MENIQEQVNENDNNLNQNTPIGNPISNQQGNFLLIIGVIVIMLVIGVGAYYLGTKKAPTQSQNPEVALPTPQSTSTPSADETTNWKTYTNNGYSIKYPDSLKYSTDTYDGIGGMVTVDTWSAYGNTYTISVYSCKESVNSKLEFPV